MTLDWETIDTIILGEDLKPGDCIRGERGSHDMGIVVATTCVLDERGKKLQAFYEDKPAIEMYDINCPSDGPYSTPLDIEKKFLLINSRKDILYIYKTIDYQLLKRSADLINRRNDLVEIQQIAVNNMNDKCDKLKRELNEDTKNN